MSYLCKSDLVLAYIPHDPLVPLGSRLKCLGLPGEEFDVDACGVDEEDGGGNRDNLEDVLLGGNGGVRPQSPLFDMSKDEGLNSCLTRDPDF